MKVFELKNHIFLLKMVVFDKNSHFRNWDMIHRKSDVLCKWDHFLNTTILHI